MLFFQGLIWSIYQKNYQELFIKFCVRNYKLLKLINCMYSIKFTKIFASITEHYNQLRIFYVATNFENWRWDSEKRKCFIINPHVLKIHAMRFSLFLKIRWKRKLFEMYSAELWSRVCNDQIYLHHAFDNKYLNTFKKWVRNLRNFVCTEKHLKYFPYLFFFNNFIQLQRRIFHFQKVLFMYQQQQSWGEKLEIFRENKQETLSAYIKKLFFLLNEF